MLYTKLRPGITVVLLSITLMFSPFVFAQPGMESFNEGVKAAKAEDFKTALKKFQKAKKAGLDSTALEFNLGVTYYRLGQYEKAKTAFTGLTKIDKYSQIAYYNLGLIANKQDKKSEAISAFQLAYQTGESDKVKGLSREALKRLGTTPKRSPKPAKKWSGLISASFASDSNVALVNDDVAGVTSNSDTSMILSAFGANWLTGNSKDGLRLFLRAYLQNYSTEIDYNYTQYGIGIAKYARMGEWRNRYGGYWDETYLGGTSYQRIFSGEVRARNYVTKNNQLRLRYKFSSIDATDPAYDYLGGLRHQLRAGMQMRNKGNRIRAYYEYEMNDREDYDNPAGTVYTFKSYSPTRHTFRVTGWLDITKEWELRLDARQRTSKYSDDHVLASSATELREDTQTRFSARLSKEMARDLNLEMAYTATKNDSSIDAESYDRNLASLGLAWKF